MFSLRCHVGLHHLLLVTDYVAEVQLRWMNLQEVLCHGVIYVRTS